MADLDNRQKKAAFVVVLAVTLLSMRLSGPSRELTLPEQVLREVLLPFQQTLMRSSRTVSVFVEGVSRYPEMKEEYRELESRLEEVRMELAEVEEIRREDVRLRQLLALEPREEYNLLAAEVVARNIKNWENTLTINRGTRQGVRINDAVITFYGLVGKVSAVTPNSSEVRLLNDRTASVAAMTERSRFPAVIEGVGDGSGLLQLNYLPYDAPISVNQNIITSGLGGVTPKGIRIGYVRSIEYNSDGLIKKAIVQPHEDFDRLEEVMVITGFSGGAAR